MQKIAEWDNPSPEVFRNEIMPRYQPAVLRGIAQDWPAIKTSQGSPQKTCDYLQQFYNGTPITNWVGSPEIKGRFFYTEDMRHLNFLSTKAPLDQTLTNILNAIGDENPPALYSGSVSLESCFPGFVANNPLTLVDAKRNVNIWIGNKIKVPPHYDMSDNIACVVSGRRHFTLFPPEQLKNLYVGPLEFNPAGQAISLVDFDAPDFIKYPLAEQALMTAQESVLEPGDAIYIPSLWWHGVKSLEKFNVLVNYWWDETFENAGSPFVAMIHALMSIGGLSPERRAAWQEIYEHYIFQNNGDPAAHIPPHVRGVLEPMNPNLAAYLQRFLVSKINP